MHAGGAFALPRIECQQLVQPARLVTLDKSNVSEQIKDVANQLVR